LYSYVCYFTKNGEIIHYIADDVQLFKAWLAKHGIRDITGDDGISKVSRVAKVKK
jgi:hypothetical protein